MSVTSHTVVPGIDPPPRAEQQEVSWGSRGHTRDPSEQPHCHSDRLEP